ncbi:MAG: pseudouridine synthase [Myxococcota bacterium]
MLEVLARTERWVVVNKPSGLAVHQSARVRDRDTVMRFARRQFGDRVDPVHRLDRATSGCLLLSLDPQHTGELAAAHSGSEKVYVVFVRGRMTLGELRCEAPLRDDRGIERSAVTVFTAVASSAEPRVSLVLARPVTGRTHQIRRHLRDLSHPVLGDSSHGDTRVNQWFRAQYGLGRLALHCASLRVAGEVEVRAPLAPELRAFGERLPWWAEVASTVEVG